MQKTPTWRGTTFYDHALEKIAGQIYGIAWFNQGKEFWYNADQVTEAGLTSPSELVAEGKWTWDAALEFAQKLTKKEGPNTTRWGFYYAYYSTGLVWASPQGLGR